MQIDMILKPAFSCLKRLYSCIQQSRQGMPMEATGAKFEIIHNIKIDISKQIKPAFEIIPKRWRVERTFSWFGGYRRLAKDFEYTAYSEENFIYIYHTHLLLKRL